jgi:hypothetical protein
MSGSEQIENIAVSIKLFGLIPRRPDLTREQFHDHYRHPHGTMGRHMSTMRGYVQSHQIHTDRLIGDQTRFEAVAEVWLDNERDAREFRSEPILVKYLIEDEPKFVDMPKLKFLVSREEVLASGPRLNSGLSAGDEMWSPANRPLSVKLLHFVSPEGDPKWAQGDDIDLGFSLGALRHVRCHPIPAFHADATSFRGVHELWWPTREAFHRGVEAAPDAFAALLSRAGASVTLLVQAERFI